MCNTTSDGGREGGGGGSGGSSLDSVGLKKRGVETDMEAGTVWPKTRRLVQHGGPPGRPEESEPAGVIFYVIDGPYHLPFPYCTGCPDRSCPACELMEFPAAVM